MRYFLNTSAARPIVADGQTFEFELVGCRGGSWLGVLAVEDNSMASILANARAPNTDEISEEIYLAQKKKSTANSVSSPAWPKPNGAGPHLAVADRVGSLMSPAASSPDPTKPIDHNSVSGLTAISLMTTRNSPPAEPLLAETKKRNYAA